MQLARLSHFCVHTAADHIPLPAPTPRFDVQHLGAQLRRSFPQLFRHELGTVVRKNILRDSPVQRDVRQRFDYFDLRSLLATRIATHSHVYSSISVIIRSPLSSCVFPAHKVVAQHMVHSFRSQPDTRSISQPQPPSRLLFLRHFQRFPSPNSLYSVFAHMPASIPQHRCDPPVAIASVFAGQVHDLSRQRVFIRSVDPFIALCSSPLPQQPTGMPLGNPIACGVVFPLAIPTLVQKPRSGHHE